MSTPAVILLALGLVTTFLPGLEQRANLAAVQMHDRVGYAGQVLDSTTLPLPAPEEHGPILPGILRGLASSLGAVALAALALRRRRTVGVQPGITQAVGRILTGLRQLYSGRAG